MLWRLRVLSVIYICILTVNPQLPYDNLHNFLKLGVTHLPEIQRIDLEILFKLLRENPESENETNPVKDLEKSTVCILLATDGVWDNWVYEDVSRFLFDQSCLQAVLAGSDGAQRIVTSFMQRNSYFAKKNFGNQADNATGILLYLSYASSFST
jgi:hypothetical protein